jgi:hypothetical protein
MIEIPIILFILAIPFVLIGAISTYRYLHERLRTETRWINLP